MSAGNMLDVVGGIAALGASTTGNYTPAFTGTTSSSASAATFYAVSQKLKVPGATSAGASALSW